MPAGTSRATTAPQRVLVLAGRGQRHVRGAAKGRQVRRHPRVPSVGRQRLDAHRGLQLGRLPEGQAGGQVVAPGRRPHLHGAGEAQGLGALPGPLLDADDDVAAADLAGDKLDLEAVLPVAQGRQLHLGGPAEGAQVGGHTRLLTALRQALEAHGAAQRHPAGEADRLRQVVLPDPVQLAVGDLEDHGGAVVAADVEAALRVAGDAVGEAPDAAGGGPRLEAGDEVGHDGIGAVRVAEQGLHLVPRMGGELGAAGAEGDEGGVAVPGGELLPGVEVDAHRRPVRRHEDGRLLLGQREQRVLPRDRQHRVIAGDGEVVPDLVALHEGVALEVAVAEHVDPLRGARAALLVVAVVRSPQLVGDGMEGHADDVAHPGDEDASSRAVGVELHDGAALGAVGKHVRGAGAGELVPGLHAAQVAGRADADVELLVLFVEDDRLGVVPGLVGQVGDEDLGILVEAVAVGVDGPDHLVLLADVHVALVERQSVAGPQAAEDDGLLVGDAVAVAVGQGHDLAPPRDGVEHALGAELQVPRASRNHGEEPGAEARRQVDTQALGDTVAVLLRHLDLDLLQTQVDFGGQGAGRIVGVVVLGGHGAGGEQAQEGGDPGGREGAHSWSLRRRECEGADTKN